MKKLDRRLTMPAFVAGLIALIVFGQRLAARADSEGNGSEGDAGGPPGASRPAPSFEARTLTAKVVRFPADYKGKLVLLDFWATWCPPCRAEIPHLRAAQEKFKDQGLELLGITLDKSHRISADQVRDFITKQKIIWPQVYDDAIRIAEKYRVGSIPAGFLVDGDSGHILAAGQALRGEALAKTLKQHLEAKRKR